MTSEQQGQDDFDHEAWLKNQTLPLELGPARAELIKHWLEAHGFADVQVKYKALPDKFRIIMQCGQVETCCSDEDAEKWLRRAAEECNAMPKELVAFVTEDAIIAGTFRGDVPHMSSVT